jgi:hypothetical protein
MARFGKLYDNTKTRLSRVLATVRGEPTGQRPTTPVRIKLGDLPAPLRAVVRDESNGGILIEAELPWLTVGSAVQAEFTDGREKSGRVHWFGVDATRAGSARLRIFVDLSSHSEPIQVRLPDVAADARPSRWRWPLATAILLVAACAVAFVMARRPAPPAMLPSPVAADPTRPRTAPMTSVPKQQPEPAPAEAVSPSPPASRRPAAKATPPRANAKRKKR